MPTNYTKLADLYAIAAAEADAAKKRAEALRKQIIEAGAEYQFGDAYTVQVALSERSSLDRKAVEEILSAEQVAGCMKKTLVESLRVRAQTAMVA